MCPRHQKTRFIRSTAANLESIWGDKQKQYRQFSHYEINSHLIMC